MEEEGSVVYYEGSPGALWAQGEEEEAELVLKEEEEQALSHTISDSSAAPQTAAGSSPWHYLDIRKLVSANEKAHLEEMVDEIKVSPLLTDEDLQLVLSTTNMDTAPNHTYSPGDSAHTSHWQWKQSLQRYLVYSLPMVLSVGWCLHSQALLLIVGVALLLIVGVALTSLVVLKVNSHWRDQQVRQSQRARSEYYSAMDKLLTQLTVTIRWLQEAEVVGWGLTRPLTSLPASRLDRCHTHKFLRGRVLHSCWEVLVQLRVLTRQLCTAGDVKLAAELEDRGSYLAFTQLNQLHRHMTQEGHASTGPQGGVAPAAPQEMDEEMLSMESIKDACSLLAVQNSELLRRLCLSAMAAAGSDARQQPPHQWMVARFSRQLETLVPLLRENGHQLEWSLNYHKNMLFGTPPTRVFKTKEAEMNSDLRPLLDEVHCMDLKAQAVLRRVREMGVSLTEDHAPPQELLLESQLLAIQADLRGLEAIADSVSTILHQQNSKDRLEPTENGSSCAGSTASEEEEEDEKEAEDPKKSGEYSDEEVFEGCAQEDEASGEPLGEELDVEKGHLASEVPAHMMTELKGVLTVRNHEREKRRLLRRGAVAATPTLQHDQGITPTLQQDQTMLTLQQGSSPTAETNLQETQLTQTTPTNSDCHLPKEDPHIATPPFMHGHTLSSEMAAAIRLRRQAQNEETYS